MGGLSPWHLIILAVLLLIVFGGSGKLSSLMGDAAKGVRSFRDGLKDDETDASASPPQSLPPLPRAEADFERDPVAR